MSKKPEENLVGKKMAECIILSVPLLAIMNNIFITWIG